MSPRRVDQSRVSQPALDVGTAREEDAQKSGLAEHRPLCFETATLISTTESCQKDFGDITRGKGSADLHAHTIFVVPPVITPNESKLHRPSQLVCLPPKMPTTERLLVHLSSVRYRRYSRVCKDNDNRLVAPFINKPLPLLRAATVQQSKQLHPAMEVKTASSLNNSVLNPAVFITPSPLRYAHHVSLNASAFSSNP